jgi:hypothetical protein
MGLLIAVVMLSKQMSAFGAGAVMKVGNSLTGSAKKFATGSARFAGSKAWSGARWTAKKSVGQGLYRMQHAILASENFGSTKRGRALAAVLGAGAHGYHEMKEKSGKAHEEYVKNRQEAIEEHDNKTIANARINLKSADEAVGFSDKVKALKDAKKEQKDLQSAKKAGAPVDRDLAVATEKVRLAQIAAHDAGMNPTLKAAQAAEEKATKDLTEAKKKAAVAYAENIRGLRFGRDNLISWAAAGPGGDAAGNKIIASTLKKLSLIHI